ncbi:MAG: hypothetical protein AB2L07_20930 [Thermoanaerobaculaceae bacterium]
MRIWSAICREARTVGRDSSWRWAEASGSVSRRRPPGMIGSSSLTALASTTRRATSPFRSGALSTSRTATAPTCRAARSRAEGPNRIRRPNVGGSYLRLISSLANGEPGAAPAGRPLSIMTILPLASTPA